MTVVKPKSEGHSELLETADRLHSAAIHLLRRLRVGDRESGIGPAQLSALSVLVFGGAQPIGPPRASGMTTNAGRPLDSEPRP